MFQESRSWLEYDFFVRFFLKFNYRLGDLLRRVFASISSGLFLPGGSGINDPCERERVDVSEKLSKQMREDITYKAQHVLRLLSFMVNI